MFLLLSLSLAFAGERPIQPYNHDLSVALLAEFDPGEFVVGDSATALKKNRRVHCVRNNFDDVAISLEVKVKKPGGEIGYEQLAMLDAEGNLQAVIDPVRSEPAMPYFASVVLPQQLACGVLPENAYVTDNEPYVKAAGIAFEGSVSGEDGTVFPLIYDERSERMVYVVIFGRVVFDDTDDGLLTWDTDVTRYANRRNGICRNPIWFNEPSRIVSIKLQCPSDITDPR